MNCKFLTNSFCSITTNKSWFSLDMFKDYFDVTNSYVLKKIKIIFLPFLVKAEDWKQ